MHIQVKKNRDCEPRSSYHFGCFLFQIIKIPLYSNNKIASWSADA